MKSCIYIKKNGERCKNKASAGSDYCHVHSDERNPKYCSYIKRNNEYCHYKAIPGEKYCDLHKKIIARDKHDTSKATVGIKDGSEPKTDNFEAKIGCFRMRPNIVPLCKRQVGW